MQAYTVDREIYAAKKFSAITFNNEIKLTKYLLRLINGVSLYMYGRVVIGTKIKPGENSTNKIFYRWKIPDLQYMRK